MSAWMFGLVDVVRRAGRPVVERLVLARCKRREARWVTKTYAVPVPWWYRWWSRMRRRWRLPYIAVLATLAAGHLPPVAGAAGLKTAKASGKSSVIGTWTPEAKPAVGDDIVIPSGVTVEWNSLINVRSIEVTGTGGLSGTTELVVGALTANAGKVAVKFASTATITWNSKLELSSTVAEVVTVALGTHELTGNLLVVSGKYKSEESVKSAATVKVSGSASIEVTAGELSAGASVEAQETTVLIVSGATVKAGAGISLASTVTVTDNASTIWKPQGAAGTFGGGSHHFKGLVELLGNQIVTGANEFDKLAIQNKGAIAGKGVRLTEAVTQTVTVLTTNGTLAEPARFESSVAGKAATLAIAEQEVASWLIVKDITVPVGVLYVPKPAAETANAGGNATVGTTIKFEAKPSGGKVQKVEASLSFAGALPRGTTHQLPATLNFVGSLGRSIVHGLTAALSFAGLLGRAVLHGLAAALSFAGLLGRATIHALAATLSFSASVGRGVVRELTATLSFAGSVGRATAHGLAASLVFAGVLGRTIGHGLAAGLSFTGSVARRTVHGLSATLSFAASMFPAATGKFVRAFTAALSLEGQLGRRTTRQLPAVLSFSGVLGRATRRPLAAALSFTGSLSRTVGKPFVATLSFAGSLGRRIRHDVSAGLSFLGRMVPSREGEPTTPVVLYTGATDELLYGSGAFDVLLISSGGTDELAHASGAFDKPLIATGATDELLTYSGGQ